MGIFLNRGIEEFESVVNSKIYVDKTDMIDFFNDVIETEQRYVCVSRPRRFGKSVTANMIAAYFEKDSDSRSLFEGRKLSNSSGWDRNLNKYDVIRIDMAEIMSDCQSGKEAIDYIGRAVIRELCEEYLTEALDDEEATIANVLARINEKYGYSFIIIIDEWDALFRENKADVEVQKRYIDILRTLFKGNRSKKFTALAYITGILPIKKYNSESALNNFYEYTMLNPKKLAPYIGFNENEVKELCDEYDMDYDKAMEWYDGYSFKHAKHICGPNSIVRAMLDEEYDNYWSQTVAYNSLKGYITMNFDGLKDAVKIMLGGQRVKVNVMSFENDMVSFANKDDIITVLIHLGYLAYDNVSKEAYIPNREVREIFERTIDSTGWNELIETLEASEDMLRATVSGHADQVARLMDECHMKNTSILNYNNENALASCIMLAYYTARKNYSIVRELPAGYGYADLVFVPKRGYDAPAMIIELKWDKSAETAIQQIKSKKYIKGLDGYHGTVLLVGISYEKAAKGENNKKHSCVIEQVLI